MTFRLQASKVHLTYKTHLDLEAFTAFLQKCPARKIFSFVHEEGSESEKEPTPYEHTHVFIWFKQPLNTIDPRYFDFEKIHPNIQNKKSIKWAKHIVLHYHLGEKKGSDNKTFQKDPVFLHQEGVAEWKFEEDQYKIAIAAPTLVDAGLELGVEPKSLADIKTLRAESKKRGFDCIAASCTREYKKINWTELLSDNDVGRAPHSVVLRGPPCIGKTNFAISQFPNTFKVEDLDELKSLPEDTQCIVFDECLFDKCSKKTQVSLTDWEQPRTIHTRNTNARIPANVHKIFTCNEDEHNFGPNPHPSVLSRIHTMDVTSLASMLAAP